MFKPSAENVRGWLVRFLVLLVLITAEKEQGQGSKGLMLKLAPELPAH